MALCERNPQKPGMRARNAGILSSPDSFQMKKRPLGGAGEP